MWWWHVTKGSDYRMKPIVKKTQGFTLAIQMSRTSWHVNITPWGYIHVVCVKLRCFLFIMAYKGFNQFIIFTCLNHVIGCLCGNYGICLNTLDMSFCMEILYKALSLFVKCLMLRSAFYFYFQYLSCSCHMLVMS